MYLSDFFFLLFFLSFFLASSSVPSHFLLPLSLSWPQLFLATAATSALLKYIEFIQSITFAPHSIKCTLKTLEGQMRLDVTTVRNLEILAPLAPQASKRGSPQGSLLGTAFAPFDELANLC